MATQGGILLDDERKPGRGKRALLWLITGLVSLCIIVIGAMLITDYRPEALQEIDIPDTEGSNPLQVDTSYKIATFNIGFAGLSAERDHITDGGKNSRAASADQVLQNLDAVREYIDTASADFYLFQSVDERSRRSFEVNQRAVLMSLPNFASIFSVDYQVPYDPFPILRPLGNVTSGLLQLSKIPPEYAERIAMKGQGHYLAKLLDMDRCLVASRFPVENGRDLVIINAHFAQGGGADAAQFVQLQELLTRESRAGNYVILGGDFGHALPGTEAARGGTGVEPGWATELELEVEDYAWAVDAARPTHRSVNTAYRPGVSFIAATDGFLVSKDVELESVRVKDLGFQHSNHQPVEMVFRLR